MVHFSSSTGDSSSRDSSNDEGDMESVSFEDMLEQARAQSDIYSAEEDSDDEDNELCQQPAWRHWTRLRP